MRNEKCIQNLWENPKGRRDLRGLDIDGLIVNCRETYENVNRVYPGSLCSNCSL